MSDGVSPDDFARMNVHQADGRDEHFFLLLDGAFDQGIEAEEPAHESGGDANSLMAADGARGHNMDSRELGQASDEKFIQTLGEGFPVHPGAEAGERDDRDCGLAGGEKAGGDVELIVDPGQDEEGGKPNENKGAA